MTLTRHIAALWGLAVILIAMTLAPSTAEAHFRHVAPISTVVHSAVPATAGVKAELPKPGVPSFYSTASSSDHNAAGSAAHSGCTDQCGDGASHACFAFTVPIGSDDAGPAFHGSRNRIADFPIGAGLTPDALRKPPKSFV
jgi:hypothetical protein